MWKMLQRREPDDYVVATGETNSVRDFAKLAFGEVGIERWERFVRTDKRYLRPADVQQLCGDASKASRKLQWKPKTKFRELVRIMVKAELESLA
jgi:GDPmannose 4,6-dehydratase